MAGRPVRPSPRRRRLFRLRGCFPPSLGLVRRSRLDRRRRGLEKRGIEPDPRAETHLAHARARRRGRGTRGAKIPSRHSRVAERSRRDPMASRRRAQRRGGRLRHGRGRERGVDQRRASAHIRARVHRALTLTLTLTLPSGGGDFRRRRRRMRIRIRRRVSVFVSSLRGFPRGGLARLEGDARARVELRGVFQLDASRREAHAFDRVRVLDAERQRDPPSKRRHRHRLQTSRGKPQFPFPVPFRARARPRPRARRRSLPAPHLGDDGEGVHVDLLRRRERGVEFALFSRRRRRGGRGMVRASVQDDVAVANLRGDVLHGRPVRHVQRQRRREGSTRREDGFGDGVERAFRGLKRRGKTNGHGRVLRRRRHRDDAGAARRDGGGGRRHRADRDRGEGAGAARV